ncbi:DNA-binding response regulator [Paenibacillus baekrokdamisoli]|uniref:DNA-binding response regulator n=1 Tax=Paenibacillus baekrokdamisoli TaxID=1712516 RepID=A0A3G9J2C3_9BACL|nr:response regulator [Paenibacillus baekrokdamisoli]MBB3068440.1 two-component SAPR family response regulator [Paenibacillus baekrokdamisoli]BBH22515.1 DNA-binding response regulator [Paenibacillus baekrokdamisoli]
MLQAFLVDDELHMLNMLEMFLLRTGKVEIAGRFSNAYEAIEAIRHNAAADVWFLDIEMPGMTGLELAEHIHSGNPNAAIVFVTAYHQYAIEAFDIAAVDYLLKPVEMARLMKTIERISIEAPVRPFSRAQANEPQLQIQLLGAFHVSKMDGSSLSWRTAKEKELFAYLLLHYNTAVHRDKFIAQLWPNERYEKAKIYLHTCVSFLRKDLRNCGLDNVILYERETYRLNAQQVSSDYMAIMSCTPSELNDRQLSIAEVEQALQIYKGGLLTDEDYPWAYEAAAQLDNMVVTLFLKLIKHYMDQEEYSLAVKAAMQVIEHSPYEEEAYRLLMQAYLSQGKHDRVLKTYRWLEDKLGELRIQPSLLTKQVFEQIQ